MKPFEIRDHLDHKFKPGTKWKSIWDLYLFDRKLRLLVFNAIERIEISLRTRIIYHQCVEFGSNW